MLKNETIIACCLVAACLVEDVEGEQTVVDGMYVESSYRRKLSRYEYDFSMEGNTTFYFYLSNFTTPMSFEVRDILFFYQIEVNIVVIRPLKKKDVVLPFRCQNMGLSVGKCFNTFFFLKKRWKKTTLFL